MVDTVLVDQETIYAPRHGNDRLLLGLKGSVNEYELDLLRQRSLSAQFEKARRGELAVSAPVGFVKAGDRYEKDRNRRVQEAITLVFPREKGFTPQAALTDSPWNNAARMLKAMAKPIEQVTIVGGGTAGWLTAIILNANLNMAGEKPRVLVTLIESPNIPTIGVGESTIQNLKNTLKRSGLDEAEFLRRSNGSFKLGVRFLDWSKRGDGDNFFHPLDNPPLCGGLTPAYHFKKFGAHWLGTSFGENVAPNASIIAAGKGPRPLAAPSYQYDVNYAYHVDAGQFAELMRHFATARGVKHIRDDVVDIEQTESGMISALHLRNVGRHPVEFVVDCSGFRALVWNRMGARPFIHANNRLFNDRAIPLQVEHRDPTKIEPCTRAQALSAGWAWRVPLYNRVGTGYVYSSAFITDDQAKAEFVSHLRKTGDLAADAPEPDTRVIQMRIGHTPEPWIKNCVAIGLSQGFVEPLEATAIYSIDVSARRLVMNFPDKDFAPELAKAYNSRAARMTEEVIDFLQLNYLTSNRDEPFWRANRNNTTISDWLRDRLELWKRRFPDMDDTEGRVLFDSNNFLYVLYPKRYFENIRPPLEHLLRREDWKSFGRELKQFTDQLKTMLPSHFDLLTHIRTGGTQAEQANPKLEKLLASATQFLP